MAATYEDRFWTSSDGLNLHYRNYPGPEGSTLCPVLCMHGLTRNARDFGALAEGLSATRRVIFLEEGDVCEIKRDSVRISDKDGNTVQRKVHESELSADAAEKGEFAHYMLKEIHEQPKAITNTLEGRLGSDHVVVESFGNGARAIFDKVEHVQIVACGTSYNSGMVARYWFEEIAGVYCDVVIGSEFRYR